METWIGRKETPCTAVIDYYRAGKPGKYWGPWEDSYPDENDDLEWHLVTAKSGIKSHRLNIIATQADLERIESDLYEYIRSR